MQLLSVNVSKPKLKRFKLKFVTTAFDKKALTGPVKVDFDNIVGDKQADLMNHGGLDKAVYGFSHKHYAYWQQQLDLAHIDYGQFGENLTIDDLDEAEMAIGDRLQINDCILEVCQPRIPCYKISYQFKNVAMLNKFIDYAHTGVYFRVIQPGTIEAGSELQLIYKHPANITIKDLFLAHFDSQFADQEKVMRQAVELPELAESWRAKVSDRLHLIDLYHQRQKAKKTSK